MRSIATLFLALAASCVFAQDWPTKPVRIVVPAPPGTGPDIAARLIADKLAGIWGQQAFVENRPGAGGIPGVVALARSSDAHTLGVIHTAAIALTPHLFKDPQFNVDADLVTVSGIVTSPLLIAVNPGLGVANLKDFIALAKSKPDQINFALPLLNSVPHLAGVQLSGIVGIRMLAVPYTSSAGSSAAVITGDGGHVTIDAPAALLAHVKAGKLRAIAITSPKRVPGFDDLPTAAETVPGFEAAGWFAMFGPARMPEALIAKVNRDVNGVIQMPDIVARLAPMALYPHTGSAQEAGAFVKADRERWAKVLKEIGAKPE